MLNISSVASLAERIQSLGKEGNQLKRIWYNPKQRSFLLSCQAEEQGFPKGYVVVVIVLLLCLE